MNDDLRNSGKRFNSVRAKVGSLRNYSVVLIGFNSRLVPEGRAYNGIHKSCLSMPMGRSRLKFTDILGTVKSFIKSLGEIMLKIYVCHGEYESVVAVVSDPEENASKLMIGCYAYRDENSGVYVLEIYNGLYVVYQAD